MTVPTHLDRRFREAAEREGLVDVAYDLSDSPVGELLVAVTDRGLCRIAYRPDAALDELAADFGARVLRLPRRLDRTRRELDEYFAGKRHEFDLELDLSPVARVPPRGAPRARPRPVRPGDHLRRARGQGRQAPRRPGRRRGDEPQPDPDRAALPPRDRRKRDARRLRRQASTARSCSCGWRERCSERLTS